MKLCIHVFQSKRKVLLNCFFKNDFNCFFYSIRLTNSKYKEEMIIEGGRERTHFSRGIFIVQIG